MIAELSHHVCIGDDGSPLFVVEHRHVFARDGTAERRHRGAAWMTLLSGEPVRYIDDQTFEVIATGELLVHELGRCHCALTVISSRNGDDFVLTGRA